MKIHVVVVGNHAVILPASGTLHGCRGQYGDMGGGVGGGGGVVGRKCCWCRGCCYWCWAAAAGAGAGAAAAAVVRVWMVEVLL
jgi:hypothetical protein